MRTTLVPRCRSELVDVWWAYGGQVRTAGHLADTSFGPNSPLLSKKLKKFLRLYDELFEGRVWANEFFRKKK